MPPAMTAFPALRRAETRADSCPPLVGSAADSGRGGVGGRSAATAPGAGLRGSGENRGPGRDAAEAGGEGERGARERNRESDVRERRSASSASRESAEGPKRSVGCSPTAGARRSAGHAASRGSRRPAPEFASKARSRPAAPWTAPRPAAPVMSDALATAILWRGLGGAWAGARAGGGLGSVAGRARLGSGPQPNERARASRSARCAMLSDCRARLAAAGASRASSSCSSSRCRFLLRGSGEPRSARTSRESPCASAMGKGRRP